MLKKFVAANEFELAKARLASARAKCSFAEAEKKRLSSRLILH
jgi:hypothetical protein